MESIKKISEYVAQLRRVGKGHGMTESFLYQHHVIMSFLKKIGMEFVRCVAL